jgi:hypothetical protein
MIVGAGPEFRCRIEVAFSLVCGAHDCHASIAPSADDHGQWTSK